MKNLLFHEIHQQSRLSVKRVNDTLKDFELYSSQWSILFCLTQFGSMTQKEIWQYLNIEAPTVTRTIARLEENGWVFRREGSDKRAKVVHLSPFAEQHIPEIERQIQQVEEELLSSLSQEEQNQLALLLKKIGHNFKKEDGVND